MLHALQESIRDFVRDMGIVNPNEEQQQLDNDDEENNDEFD